MKKLLIAGLIFLTPTIACAASSELSGLTELVTTPADSDEFYVNDGGVSKKIQYSNIISNIVNADLSGSAGITSANIADGTIDADAMGANSVDSSELVDGSVDISHLADGTDGQLITWDAAGAPAVVAVGTSGHVLTSNGAGAAPTFQASGAVSDTNSPKLYSIPGSATLPLEPVFDLATGAEDGIAPVVQISSTNQQMLVASFVDTDDTFRQIEFDIPSDVAADENVTITFKVIGETGEAEDVALIFAHYAFADGEAWDGNMTEEALTGTFPDTGADIMHVVKSDESSTSLGWTAGDHVVAYIGRDGDHATDDAFATAVYLVNISVEIPRD